MRSLSPVLNACLAVARNLPTLAGGMLLGTCLWSRWTFGPVWFEQLAYHLRFGAMGLLQADSTTLWQFALAVIAGPLVLCVALSWAARRLRWLPTMVLVAGLLAFFATFRVDSYIASFFGPDVFAAHEVPAREVPVTAAGPPRSLLLVYVESLEGGYQDPRKFGADLLPRLSAIQRRHSTVRHFHQADGAHWTIAGIVASQCGVPLKVSLLPPPEDRRFGLQRYLPGAVCLGDLLAERGYENVFMNGPDLAFADLGTFLRDHGYGRRLGAREWRAEGLDAHSLRHWGLRDAPLLDRAGRELERLMASGRLFNLTVLTVDTHGPRGLLGEDCRRRGARDFRGILGCTDADVAALLELVERRGWLDRLSVAVIGDHIAMENPLMDTLSTGERQVFNLWMHQPRLAADREEVLHFDWYPTLLRLAGWRAEGGRLGLGYCLLEGCGAPPLPPGRIELFRRDLLNRSPRYDALWTMPAGD